MVVRIGFVGAGLMGAGMVKNLLKAGHEVTVFQHRRPLDHLEHMGARVVKELEGVAGGAEVVFLVLPGSPEVEEALLGKDGLVGKLAPGSAVIDSSTSFPGSTRKLARALFKKGIRFLDAPLTGGPANAEDGTLTMMVGGDSGDFERYRPLFQAVAANVFHVGGHGAGHVIKLLNNYLALINVAATAEVFHFAAKLDVDLKSVWDVVRASGGNSKGFETIAPRILSGEYPLTFELNKAYKDLRYVSDLARDSGMPLGIVSAVMHEFELARAMGFGEHDYSSVGRVWETLVGVAPRAELAR